MYMNAGLTLAFADDVLRALGAPAATAECVAEFLVNADKSGSNTHGVGLLPLYAKMIAAGSLDPLATPAMDKSAGIDDQGERTQCVWATHWQLGCQDRHRKGA